MSLKQKILVAIVGVGLTLAGAASASATPWQHAHPRRVPGIDASLLSGIIPRTR